MDGWMDGRMDRWMNRRTDELMNQGTNFLRDAIWDHDWLKRWNLCGNVIAWIRAEFILEWVYTSLILLFRHQDPDARPLFSVETLPREHTCCDTWSNGTSVLNKMESQELDFLSTWNNYKKKTKYDFQTLDRQQKTVIPETGKLVQWALWMPHLIASREFSGYSWGRENNARGTDVLPEFFHSQPPELPRWNKKLTPAHGGQEKNQRKRQTTSDW